MLKSYQNGVCTIWGINLKMKVLGKEFEDYSPQCGEMSEGQRGQAPVGRTLFQKGFPQ